MQQMKRHTDIHSGREELRAARRESRWLFWSAGLFSAFVNLLMLTGPLFMLQVYDRVLGSRSQETLLALSVLVVFLYTTMGILDYARGRVLARIGARFQERLDKRVFAAMLKASSAGHGAGVASTGLADLEAVQRLLSSPMLGALFDIPWTPIFLAGIFLFHPWLGILALCGGAVLIFVTVLNQIVTRRPVLAANSATTQAQAMAAQLRSESDLVQSLGMRKAAFERWHKARERSLDTSIQAADAGGAFGTLSKTFRMLLQSAILGLGAYLVLQNQLTAGAMIAGSILMGRALAPVELAIGQWPLVQRARKGWQNLAVLLAQVPPDRPRMALPVPRALLVCDQVTVVPPGAEQASLRMISFVLQPGQAMGVIGPSGAGKSTLANALTGVWRPAGGKIRLDGATLDQYDPDVLGTHVGYLPQRVQLFDGTIAENIARLQPDADAGAIVAAAKKAAAHEMILKLPDGYNTRVTGSGGRLSGGQLQRVGLARAMYGDPAILVLDEPNSNLDNEGTQALNLAIRSMKQADKSVLIMAHRPAALQECDLVMVVDGGVRKAFGPRDEVLKTMLKNHTAIQKSAGQGGVT